MSIAFSNFHKNTTQARLNTGTSAVGNSASVEVVGNDPIVDIHVACKDVVKMDVGSQSDPMCVLMVKGTNGQWVEFDRTEVVWNDPNPTWVKFFRCLYIFETQQPIRFAIYDADDAKAALKEHDFVGYVDTDVQTLVTNLSQELRLDLLHPSNKGRRGTLVIIPEQESACSSYLTAGAQFSGLRKMRTFSKNNPYLVIARASEAGALLPIYRSEVHTKCFSARINEFQISMQTLCNGDQAVPLTVALYDYNEKHSDEIIGIAQYSVAQLLEKLGQPIELQFPPNKSGKAKKTKKNAGVVKFTRLEITRKPTFLDYLRSGLQLNLISAVDFTASNRSPSDSNSLHYLCPGRMNSYELCISEVGGVVCPYDTDQLFPCYGFGAKIRGQVSHCFPLTFDPTNPNCAGLAGILGAYRNALSQVQLSGPTLFAPVIQAATQVATASYAQTHTYTVLMILTDGVINDMRETKDSIVAASDAPLSIIIIGIGGANFDAMDELDADDHPLQSSTGARMKRDIVQFVPFSKFLKQGGMGLAAEVLAEVPKQVDDFCKAHGFVPQMV